MLGLAQRLSERGHDVRLLASPSIDRRYGRHGWRFRAFRETPDYDAAAAKDVSTEVQVNSRNLWFNPAVGRDMTAELAAEPADLVLVDCMLRAGLSAAVASKVPTATLFHQPYSTFIARAGKLLPQLNVARAEMGMELLDSLDELYRQCDLCIVAAPRELEAEPVDFPAGVRWVGPILGGPAPAADIAALPELGGERFVLISLGTGYQAQVPILQRLVDAGAGVPRRFLVTTGPAIPPSAIEVHPNVTVAGFIPHELLLPQAELVITHAGLGTVMAALRHGLPLLCVPLGRDQFVNAEWVQSRGVGRKLSGDCDISMIAAAIKDLLASDAAERAEAKMLVQVFEDCSGADGAADALEDLLMARSSAATK